MRLAQPATWLLATPWRLVVLVAVFVAIPILVVGELAAADTHARQQAAASASANRAAVDTVASFSDRVSAISRAIGNAAIRPVSGRATALIDAFDRADQTAIQTQLELIALYSDPAVSRLLVIDANGRAVAVDPFVAGYAGTDLSARPFSKLAARGAEVGDAFVFVDDGTGRPTGKVGLAVGAPIGTQRQTGYRLVALVDLRVIAGSLIAELRTSFKDAYLIDRSGHLALRGSHAFAPDDLVLSDLSGTSAVAGTAGVTSDPITPDLVVRGSARDADNGWSVLIADAPSAAGGDLDTALGAQRALRVALVVALLLGSVLVGSATSLAIRQRRETKEALGQQTALSDVLRTISRSGFDLDAVLQTIVERAAGLVGAESSIISRRDGDDAVVLAGFGPGLVISGGPGQRIPVSEATLVGRALMTGKRQYTVDATLSPDLPQGGPRTRLVIPFMRDGKAVGTLGVSHDLPRPFSDRELQMLETFADQAAIAIENVRLFNETKESLERQTALAEILSVIADSPADQQPVVDAIARSTTRYCGAEDAAVFLLEGDMLRRVAHHGLLTVVSNPILPLDRGAVAGRAILERRTVHVADVAGAEGDDYLVTKARAAVTGQRGTLATPMLREGAPIGVILLRKMETTGYTPSQIQLVEAFADQAVIAIENVRLFNETNEALTQRTATSEILRVISETLGDPQPVMQAIVDTVLAVCSADSAGFFRRSGDDLLLRAVSGTWRGPRPSDVAPQLPFHGDSIVVSALEEGRYQHVADTSADPRYDAAAQWSRTRLAVPVLRGSETIGVIRVGRAEPGGFTDREIRLVEGFADQAAIAFENARLFNETKEALEQQTAVGDVLKTISRSVFDLQPVLDTVVEHAARLAGGDVAWLARITGQDSYRIVSRYGAAFEAPEIQSEWGQLDTMRLAASASVMGRLLRERTVLHIPDIRTEQELWEASRLIRATGSRTILAVPMLRNGLPIGGVIVGRKTLRPFSGREIQLVQTFADQAAIAIENARLFNETKEALERQRAVAEVLGEISQSGFQLQPVLESVIEAATKLCAAQRGFIYRREGDVFRLVVAHGITPEFKAFTEANPINPMGRGTVTGRVAEDGTTVHIPDVLADPEYTYWEAQRLGNFRSILGVPMKRDDEVIGVMLLWRNEPQPFADDQIALVTTFANQATIAIENVRLFDETKESLERQTAVSDVLQTISRSAFDLESILKTVVENAARLCGADLAWMTRRDGDSYVHQPGAHYAGGQELENAIDFLKGRGGGRSWPIASAKSVMGAAYRAQRTICVDDIRADPELSESGTALSTGSRSVISVPVIVEGQMIGAIALSRVTVKPFTEREIQLVETFADQAAIAIQNVRLFNEIKDKSRQLEVASRHKSEFLANMSHELRTPLNAIIGFSEVLVQGLFGEVNEKQREYLNDVIGSGQHLLSLINDILDLSKIEAGRMELELSNFSFRNALESGVTIVRERAARHDIALNVDVSDELGQVEADERKVKQILYNLLTNAVKFTPDGGNVNVTVRRDKDDVRVNVQDNGIGIAEADQARIFEEFQQVGRERSREGTGLGLTLTKRFVELHGGRIWLESAPGRGSTFTFTLPLRQDAPVRA
jgi:GAF domain-containing protein/two-component sensor histidine kinase